MYSIDIVEEFFTVFISEPVKDDPEKAAAGATRARAIIEQDFMFSLIKFYLVLLFMSV